MLILVDVCMHWKIQQSGDEGLKRLVVRWRAQSTHAKRIFVPIPRCSVPTTIYTKHEIEWSDIVVSRGLARLYKSAIILCDV